MNCTICYDKLSSENLKGNPAEQPPTKKVKLNTEKPSDNGAVCCTPCGHLFHRKCLHSWFNSSQQRNGRRRTSNPEGTCPTCRKYIMSKSLYRVYLNQNQEDEEVTQGSPQASLGSSSGSCHLSKSVGKEIDNNDNQMACTNEESGDLQRCSQSNQAIVPEQVVERMDDAESYDEFDEVYDDDFADDDEYEDDAEDDEYEDDAEEDEYEDDAEDDEYEDDAEDDVFGDDAEDDEEDDGEDNDEDDDVFGDDVGDDDVFGDDAEDDDVFGDNAEDDDVVGDDAEDDDEYEDDAVDNAENDDVFGDDAEDDDDQIE